ncbi:MAG: ribosome small subunit-dependent GTPase A [Limnobacter sp.]|uniref:ribosome small subunit-dependent GTPase A n=1 Tax=Limnobacter sp. TaxID=2003368 RepID=UPI0022C11C14|nr:ribosome small subunit-dependent GTPase A [Limnobacter sp.]MCZ8016723.1 ribosome small subunit-dependent GTPase A [Limnobacter sp.]
MADSSLHKVRLASKGKQTAQHAKNVGSPDLLNALVVASYGRHFLARDAEGEIWQVYGKGKRRDVAVGDEISILPSGDKQAWIEEIQTRRNLVYRSDALKSKMFAANLDGVLLMLAISPPYSTELLGRTLTACKHADVPLTILFNKVDILEGDQETLDAVELELFEITLGEVPTHYISVTEHPQETEALLRPLLTDKRTLILGQSGMGKSTLINLLIPDALAATNEISMALNAGKHTTTHTQMHFGDAGLELIDSPGFQAFGLHHLTEADLLNAFSDLRDEGNKCRFANCQHKREPDCAVKNGLEDGTLSPARYELYQMLKAELEEAQSQY